MDTCLTSEDLVSYRFGGPASLPAPSALPAGPADMPPLAPGAWELHLQLGALGLRGAGSPHARAPIPALSLLEGEVPSAARALVYVAARGCGGPLAPAAPPSG